MKLTAEQQAEMIAKTRNAAIALLEDLDHLRNMAKGWHHTSAELRRASALLRRLVIDGDLHKVAAPRIGKILLRIPDYTKYYRAAENAGEFDLFASFEQVQIALPKVMTQKRWGGSSATLRRLVHKSRLSGGRSIFLSIFTREFADPRERFVSLCDVSARFIRKYGSGSPANWTMDPRSIALPTAFQIGFGRDGVDGFRIPPCDRLVEKWDEWDIEYRAIESIWPRLPLLNAILDFRIASDQSGWPFSKRDPLLTWVNATGLEFPWPEALVRLGADFPARIRNLQACAGGWWRYIEGRGEVFYPC
jgi:hypothetical protein